MNRTVAALLLAGASLAPAAEYSIDAAHSSAQFSVKHMMVSTVRGEFTKVTGKVNYDPKNPGASTLTASIDAASINTREPKRDAHLKSADFFDVEKFPSLTFVSKSVRKSGDKLLVTGDLTLHGVTREVVLTVENLAAEIKDPYGLLRSGASAATKINRKDFGLTWNKMLETGGAIVGDEVAISIDIEMVRKAG